MADEKIEMLTSQHPLIRTSELVRELASPLKRFNVSVFTYTKNFLDGSKVTLSSEPQWVADYYNNELYKSSLFENDIKIYKPEFQIWIGDYDLDVYWHGKNYFNSVHSITITEPQADGCDFYFFAFPEQHEASVHYIYNNMDILYHFILYFKDKGKDLLEYAQKNKIIIPRASAVKSNNGNPFSTYFNQEITSQKMQFYRETHVHKYFFETGNFSGIKLSNREIDCIFHLLNDKTSDEISGLLNLSKRTVDSYIENIKNKLNLDTRTEVTKELKQYRMLQALRWT